MSKYTIKLRSPKFWHAYKNYLFGLIKVPVNGVYSIVSYEECKENLENFLIQQQKTKMKNEN